jgi:hypothetical protein
MKIFIKNGGKGEEVKIKIEKVNPKKEVDLSNLPTFTDGNEKMSEHHDQYVYRDE